MGERYFVTGIDTGIGKTVVSAILCEALGASYWKPVQCGDLDTSDSLTVATLLGDEPQRILPEAYRLKAPLSPHAAAEIEGVEVTLDKIVVPEHAAPLVIEGAGGLMVPFNDREYMIDLIAKTGAKVVLVSKHYLGSINHTLLSIAVLQQRNLPVAGLVFVGARNEPTEAAIAQCSGEKVLGRVAFEDIVDREMVKRYATKLEVASL